MCVCVCVCISIHVYHFSYIEGTLSRHKGTPEVVLLEVEVEL